MFLKFDDWLIVSGINLAQVWLEFPNILLIEYLYERSKKKVTHDIEKLKARCIEILAYWTGGVDVERCRLDAMPIGLPLAGCHSLEGGRAPGTARPRPGGDGPSILLF